MSNARTEQLHDQAKGLDLRTPEAAAQLFADAQVAAAQSVTTATAQIAAGAKAMANTVRAGGTLYYVAAGSSGLMAAADAMELGGTFSIPSEKIRILMAGGIPTTPDMPGDTEDDVADLDRRLADVTAQDTILTLSASGTTPYTVKAAKLARNRGACVIGIANNADTPLLELSTHGIYLPTPPEVLSGSTRMGAGTAQKIALNILSTLMALDLGHVHDGMMVNLRADNNKLRARAAAIVSRISGCDTALAQTALSCADGDVKQAVLIAVGGAPAHVAGLLAETDGHLRPALARLSTHRG